MLIVNILGLLLIILIIWWFWLYEPELVSIDKNVLTVIVENGVYEPSRIQLTTGQEVTLRFHRKDASPCASIVLFDDLNISEELPLNKTKDIKLPALDLGNYSFSCQMKMYHGELIVSDITG